MSAYLITFINKIQVMKIEPSLYLYLCFLFVS